MIRQPAVAGQFYNDDAAKLRDELDRLVVKAPSRVKAVGVISPHAGYIYSGAVAGQLYGSVEAPSTVIIIGPNHHGAGARAALYPAGEWLTPLGPVAINERLTKLILQYAPMTEIDTAAHHLEHSLEVQLPFLQYLRPDVTIAPLCLGFGDFAACRALGEGIARAIREYGDEVLMVASSDMTHYESAPTARKKDELAIREVLAMNPSGLLQACREHDITMCGVIPAVTMLVAALELGASSAQLVRYATSGDVTGDNRQVVAYAAFTVV